MELLYCLLMSCAFGGIFAAILPDPRLATTCTYNGHTYPAGSFKPSPCEYCHCDGGRAHCAIADCAPPTCVDAVRHPDQCCPVCPNGPNCSYKGHIIQHGETYHPDAYTECRCPENVFHFGLGGSGANAICHHKVAVTKPPTIHITTDSGSPEH